MSANFENLSSDLAPQLVRLLETGTLTIPYELSFEDADGTFLGSYLVNEDGTSTMTSEEQGLGEAVFPVSITIRSSNGTLLELQWSPPAVQ